MGPSAAIRSNAPERLHGRGLSSNHNRVDCLESGRGVATITWMLRRRLVVTPATAALLLVAGSAWAGPPPPPPPSANGTDAPSDSPPNGGEVRPGGAPINAPPPPPTAGGKTDGTPKDPMVIDQRTPETDLTGNWAFSRGAGSGPNYVRGADDELFLTVNPIGYYQGVSVTSGNLPPYAPKEIGGESAVLTWTGFERGETSSRVFFQLSASVEPEISVEGLRVFVKFPRTSVATRNNQRGLITKFFKTPVNEVKLSRSGKDMVAVLELRWEATPIWRFETGTNGYRVLVLEFSDTQDQGAVTDPNVPSQPSTPTDGEPEKPPAPPTPFLPVG
jgi:hypothetical protein